MNRVALGEIVEFYSGGTPAKEITEFWDEGVPWFSPKDLKQPRLVDSIDHISGAALQSTRLRMLPAGTIAIVVRGMILAHTVPISLLDVESTINQDLKALLPRTELNPAYLAAMLRAQHDLILAQVTTAAHGTKKIETRVLEQIEVPLPSLDEQQRIIAILDRAHALGARRREVLALLDSLDQSRFVELFGDASRRAVTARPSPRAPQGWSWVLLTDVARLATGHTPDRGKPEYWGGGIPWISLPEIRNLDGRTCVDTAVHVSAEGVANSSAVVLPAGTVCFSRTASIGFVTKMGGAMATSQDFHNWVPGPLLDSDYLMSALRHSRAHLLGSSDGSIHKTIYQRVALQFRVLLPPLELQRRYAAFKAAVDSEKARVQRVLEVDDELFASLQARAFRGEL